MYIRSRKLRRAMFRDMYDGTLKIIRMRQQPAKVSVIPTIKIMCVRQQLGKGGRKNQRAFSRELLNMLRGIVRF